VGIVAAVAGGALALGPAAGRSQEAPVADHVHDHSSDTDGHSSHVDDHSAPVDPSAADRKAADALVAATTTATESFGDYDAALRAGYRPNRRAGMNATHHPNPALMRDGRVLDPNAPESLVYWNAPDGRRVFMGVVYKAGPNEPAPTPGGPLTLWHTHTGPDGARCHPGHDEDCPDDTTKMMHVFVFDGVRDPFADNMVAAAGGRRAFARMIRAQAAR
jgi:hypothetical protein